MLPFFKSWNFLVEALTDIEPKLCCYIPHICVDVTGSVWDVSEDLDSEYYPLVSLVLRYTNSPAFFPGRYVVCS